MAKAREGEAANAQFLSRGAAGVEGPVPSSASTASTRWVTAGVRKVLRPARRARSLVLGPDGRLALASLTVASVLRPPCIGVAVAAFGGSAAPTSSSFGSRVLGANSESIPVSIYPAAAGHEFVCSAEGGENASCAAEAPGVASTADKLRAPSVMDLRSVTWAPLSRGPALFVVSGSGRLHIIRPRSAPLGLPAREREPPSRDVDAGQSRAQGPPAGPAGAPDRAAHGCESAGPPLWCADSVKAPAAERGADNPFPPALVSCADTTSLAWSALGQPGAEHPAGGGGDAVLIALGTSTGVSLWLWPASMSTQPQLVTRVEVGWTSCVLWSSLPASLSGSSRDTAYLAVGLAGIVRVLCVRCVWEWDEAARQHVRSVRVATAWESERFASGAVVSLGWWWDVTRTEARGGGGDVGPSRGLEEDGSARALSLKLAAGALSAVVTFRWTCRAGGRAAVVADAPTSRDWARKLEHTNVVFADEREAAQLDWGTCTQAGCSPQARHERVVTGVAFLANGMLLSSSEDGRVIVWREETRGGGDEGNAPPRLEQDAVVLDGTCDQPVFGLTPLNLGLCVAIQVTVPSVEECFRKAGTALLAKFHSSARLSRVMLLAPALPAVDGVRELVSRSVSSMIEAADGKMGVLAWDLHVWLRSQAAEVASAAVLAVWELVERLQEHAVGLDPSSAAPCARVLRCLADTVCTFAAGGGAGAALLSEAQELRSDMTDLLLFLHCHATLEVILGTAGFLEGGVATTGQLEELSHLERCSLFSLCKFALSQDDHTPRDEVLRRRLTAIVMAVEGLFQPSDYHVPCAVCAFDACEPPLLTSECVSAGGVPMRSSCALGDEYEVCWLTWLPCTDAVPLVCTGCRATRAGSFLSRAQEPKAPGGLGPFFWLQGRQRCPLCCCSFQLPESIGDDERHAAAPS
jgi:hypothetical protein